jgi:hypothetical protein
LKKNASLCASGCDTVSQAHECLDILLGVLKQVGGPGPLASFAEDHDRRAAEAKDRFLFAAPEGQV